MTPSATVAPEAAWAEAFISAQLVMPSIPKNKTAKIKTKTGADFTISYADLASIIDRVRPVLTAAGLGFAQSVEGSERGVAVTTRLFHIAGHSESFGPTVVPGGGDAQSTGSAITYARRYSLCAALGIAADEDDDGASAKTSRDSSDPGKAGGSNPSSATRAAEPRASEPPATPSATGTAEAERGDGGGTAKGKDGPAPDPACAHPKEATTTDKPGGGSYRGGFVFCTVCNNVIPSKEVGVGS